MSLALTLSALAQLAAPSYTVALGGDVVPHGDVLASVHAHGPASLLGAVAGVLSRVDLAVVNLETPVAPARPESPDGSIRFNVHADFARALAASGVDAVSIANNHGYDQGVEAVGDSVRAIRSAGITPLGAALAGEDPMAPQRFALGSSTLCVMAATRILNFEVSPVSTGVPRLAMARPEVAGEERAMLDRVRLESSRCSALVVFVHTGAEYTDTPEPRDRVFFRALAAAGADVVAGHHSHTAHPVERYTTGARVVPIYYSLGNLVSAQGSAAERAPLEPGEAFQVVRDPRTREGLLAVLRFTPDASGRLRVSESGYVPLWTQNDRAEALARGAVPTITAAAMPLGGGARGAMRARWNALVARVGRAMLFPLRELPGVETVYAPEALAQWGAVATR